MESYKEKYEMALEGIQEILGSGKDSIKISRLQQCLQGIFPELKSEDEKIRKEIIRFVRMEVEDEIVGNKWLAWLEKQGSEPNWCHHKVDLSNCSEEYRKAYYDGWNNCNMQHFQCKFDGSLGVNGKPFDYEKATIIQKDFAPKVDMPRYSIGDVLCDKLSNTSNKVSQDNFVITDIRNGMYICDKCSFPISHQDEYELVAKRIEQNPVEWSEEDERNLEGIIDEIEANKNEAPDYDIETYDRFLSWLKSIKDRLEQK